MQGVVHPDLKSVRRVAMKLLGALFVVLKLFGALFALKLLGALFVVLKLFGALFALKLFGALFH